MNVNPSTRGMIITPGTPEVKIRTELFIYMYQIAKEHAEIARTQDRKDKQAEIKESMISIIFSYTCLETYINTVGIDYLGTDWARYEGNSTEAKWIGVSKVLATQKLGKYTSVFKKGEEPFKSFLKLEEIRESLIHRKAFFEEVAATKYGNTDGTVNTINCDTAEWALANVSGMVKKLNNAMNKPPPDIWLN